jgi:hypothetical protein
VKAPIVPPAVAPVTNGAHAPEETVEEPVAQEPEPAPQPEPQSEPAPQPEERTPEPVAAAVPDAQLSPSYREEVETELQRILREAGVDTKLETILTDARAEAERKGVAMDSNLMLRALGNDREDAGKLTPHTKDQLEPRFERIAADERRAPRGSNGQQ